MRRRARTHDNSLATSPRDVSGPGQRVRNKQAPFFFSFDNRRRIIHERRTINTMVQQFVCIKRGRKIVDMIKERHRCKEKKKEPRVPSENQRARNETTDLSPPSPIYSVSRYRAIASLGEEKGS